MVKFGFLEVLYHDLELRRWPNEGPILACLAISLNNIGRSNYSTSIFIGYFESIE
jgi:hypothetical protein